MSWAKFCLYCVFIGVIFFVFSFYRASCEETPVPEEKWKLLWEEKFDKDLSNWVVEGPAIVEIRQRRLYIEPVAKKEGEVPMPGVLVWHKEDLPETFKLEFDFTPKSRAGFFLLFFSAKNLKGEDIFDPSLPERGGEFSKYVNGAIECYHISYRRGTQGNCNLRKNPGKTLVKSEPKGFYGEVDKTSHLVLVKKGPEITLTADGKEIMHWIDDGKTYGPVLGSGKIGLRQVYHASAFYDNIKAWSLAE